MIVINPSTRQFSIPGADLVFGVESDAGSEIKEFQVPRYVGNNLDLAGSFIRINYRNANGEVDSYLVNDATVNGDNVVFTWVLTPKVTLYKGHVSFVVCVTGPDAKVKWHTTLGRGQVLEGLEPDVEAIEIETADVIVQLITMVEAQTAAVETVGETWVKSVKSEGATQVAAVRSAAEVAEAAAVAEIEAKGVNTLATIPGDYTALSVAVETLNHTRGAAIVCEAAGSAVVVNDSSNLPMQGLRIFGKSTQDGIPTPEAPVEIVSVDKPVVTVCGKNLAYANLTREVTYSGSTISTSANKSEVVLSGTATKLHSYGILRTRPLSVGSYTVSAYGLNITNSSTDRIYLMNAETEKVLCNNIQDGEPKSFNITSDGTVVRIDLVFGEGSTYNNKVVKVQVEKGDVATEYEPYKVAQTVELTPTLPGIPVTSGGNYTDSDGQQWICDEVDLERGVYVKRIKSVEFTGDEIGWRHGAFSTDETKTYVFLSDGTIENVHLSICSHAVYSRDTASWIDGKYMRSDGGMWQTMTGMTLDEWKAYAAEQMANGTPITVHYPITVPIETPLSETEIAAYRDLHSNYPNTTVLNDSGAHMVVKYAADTKLYIDNKIKEALQ